jgi:hypothetical protein
MARQLAITKITTLDGFDGWDSDCYVEWMPVTYADSLKMKDMETPDDDESAFKVIVSVTKSHIIGGKVKIINEAGEKQLVDYEPEDLENMPASAISKIFADITGAQYDDPKDSVREVETNPEPTKPENTSETS